MIDNEKLIYHTIENWYFGVDNTGDVMSFENYESLKHRLNKANRPVYLVS